MEDFTVISYPGPRDSSLLSLTESRSKYMLPFGGRFRIVDFTVRNSVASGIKQTVIYNDYNDDLDIYINSYGPSNKDKHPELRVINENLSNIKACQKTIRETDTNNYIIYNGDNPSIIDFRGLAKKFKSKKSNAMLFRLSINGRASMAHKILTINQKTLLQALARAQKDRISSPNIFEMIINMMINRGVAKSTLKADYWPIKNIVDYYDLNRGVIWDREISDELFNGKIIKSQIRTEGYAFLGESSKIIRSFISDACIINGTVENSIIFPGVEIGENTYIKNSIILPYVSIGNNSRIIKTIVDEQTIAGIEDKFYTIGNSCSIGSNEDHIKNSSFPKNLFESITLISGTSRISDGTKIGGGCYIGPGLEHEFFMNKKYIYDGSSAVK